MLLKKGLKFNSKWFEGITEIVAIHEETNTLSVEIFRSEENHHSEDWILSHTLTGFENGDYTLIEIYESHSECCFVSDCALFDLMGEFAVKAFPEAGSIEHLKKLKYEADEAIQAPKDIIEYSDCLLALFSAAYKAGFSYNQLIEASKSKFEILKSRKWEKLPDGTYQHYK